MRCCKQAGSVNRCAWGSESLRILKRKAATKVLDINDILRWLYQQQKKSFVHLLPHFHLTQTRQILFSNFISPSNLCVDAHRCKPQRAARPDVLSTISSAGIFLPDDGYILHGQRRQNLLAPLQVIQVFTCIPNIWPNPNGRPQLIPMNSFFSLFHLPVKKPLNTSDNCSCSGCTTNRSHGNLTPCGRNCHGNIFVTTKWVSFVFDIAASK